MRLNTSYANYGSLPGIMCHYDLSDDATVTEATGWDTLDENRNAITHTGTWTGGSDAGAYNGDFQYSDTTGDTATFTFLGTKGRAYARKKSNYGIANIYVDGDLVTTVDLYNATTLNQQLIYETTDLLPGVHTLTMEVSGTKNASSTGYRISSDRYDRYGTYMSGLTDLGPNGYDLSEGTVGNRPARHLTFNGLKVGSGDGLDTEISTAITSTYTPHLSLFIVKMAGGVMGNFSSSFSNAAAGGDDNGFQLDHSGGRLRFNPDGEESVWMGEEAYIYEMSLYEIQWDGGGTLYAYRNGTLVDTEAVDTDWQTNGVGWYRCNIFRNRVSGSHWLGHVGEVLVFGTYPGDGTVAEIRQRLMEKWGIDGNPLSYQDVHHWYDSLDRPTVTKTNDHLISQWDDKTPFANHLVQSDTSLQMTYDVVKKSVYAVSNKKMECTESLLGDCIIYAVVDGENFGTSSNIWRGSDSYNAAIRFEQLPDTGVMGYTFGGDTDWTTAASTPFDQKAIVSFRFTDSSNLFEARVNDGTWQTVTIGDYKMPIAQLQGFQGDYYELTGYTRHLTDTEDDDLLAYLADKHGITL